MKIRLISCGICEHWYMPKAHAGHCPTCSAQPYVIHGRRVYINWQTEREVIKSGWPVILKRLVSVAQQ